MKNLKHGLKCGKRDYPLETAYLVSVPSVNYISSKFKTKLEAINHITSILDGTKISLDQIYLTKVQFIKF